MKIVTVEYRELRTGSGYNNKTVGAVAEVLAGQTPEITLGELKEWVAGQFDDEQDRGRLKESVAELEWHETELKRRIARTESKWEAILAFLNKLGVERPEDIPDTLEGLPF